MDLDQERRTILRQVADGTLDPSEAAERLAALDRDAAGEVDDSGRTEERIIRRAVTYSGAEGDAKLRKVKVTGAFRSVEVTGDDSVHEAVADGPHNARREGDTLVIDGSMLDDEDGFVFSRGQHRRGVRINVSSSNRPRPLVIRMNPDLDLDARVEAGPLTIEDVHGRVRARVAAGPLKVHGFRRPIDLRVAAGTVKARGRIDEGESRIECEAGKVLLHLDHGSNVRVKATASLGKVAMGGRSRSTRVRVGRPLRLGGEGDLLDLGQLHAKLSGMFVDDEEIVIGDGRASMDVSVAMGAADITSDDDAVGGLRWDDADDEG